MLKRYSHSLLFLVAGADMAALVLAWLAAYWLRVIFTQTGLANLPPPSLREILPYIILSIVLCPLVYSRGGLYSPMRTVGLFREVTRLFRAIAVVWAFTFLISSLMRQSVLSRLTMLTLLVAWLVLAAMSRLALRSALRRLRRHGRNLRSAAIVGAGRLGQKLRHGLNRNPWTGIAVHYFIDDHGIGRQIDGTRIAGPIGDIDRVLAEDPVDIVFIAITTFSQDRLEELIGRLQKSNVDLHVVPNLLAVQFLRHDLTQLDELPIISLSHSPQEGWNGLCKRTFDIMFSLLALIVSAIPMLIIGLLVKCTSEGPVFFRQVRSSTDGRPFSMIKFRTMIANAGALGGLAWTAPDDPRVTPFGRLLRKTSLDELPQFINVLRGDMSVVGPRPERPEFIERFRQQIPKYMLRSRVKAGITGWAQIHGMRGQTSVRKRIQYDLFYIRNWSLGLDIWITLLTPFRGLVGRNVY